MNSTYPSVTALCGFLKSKNIDCKSYDLSLEVIIKIFSKNGLAEIFNSIDDNCLSDEALIRTYELREKYIERIDAIISFLQGKNLTLAYNILQTGFLPEGNYFLSAWENENYFGKMSNIDKAKYYCSLVIDDLTFFIRRTISNQFGLSRYAEKMISDSKTFDEIEKYLLQPPNIIDRIISDTIYQKVNKEKPEFIGFTIPFPGNLLGGLISAKRIKGDFPAIKIIFGGGYVNTELRNISDSRIFKYCDYITLDDGELPLFNIVRNFSKKKKVWVRTFLSRKNKIIFLDNAAIKNITHNSLPILSFDGININKYFSMTEMLNPMHKIWSDGFWIKMTIAHGCYWRKCNFCDITLDYIGRYSPAKAETIVNYIEKLIQQTGITSFHFTDEAAPPALLREVSLEILKRKLSITWWTNIRFEKAFSENLCRLMALAGCVAVSGGLEVADERILKLINKGITVEQVSIVCHNFQKAGIMVHAYLMYGFPSQTEQELINSHEYVRQFFKNKLIQSGFWHQFILTIHSPISKNPTKFGIEITSSMNNPFSNNNLSHSDKSSVDYQKYSSGLKKAIYNYMHGVGLEMKLQNWYDFKIPKPSVKSNEIKNILSKYLSDEIYKGKVLWVAGEPSKFKINKHKTLLKIHGNDLIGEWKLSSPIADWVVLAYRIIRSNSFGTTRFEELFDLDTKIKLELSKFFKTKTWHEIKQTAFLII